MGFPRGNTDKMILFGHIGRKGKEIKIKKLHQWIKITQIDNKAVPCIILPFGSCLLTTNQLNHPGIPEE
jgi:hypothetical protein